MQWYTNYRWTCNWFFSHPRFSEKNVIKSQPEEEIHWQERHPVTSHIWKKLPFSLFTQKVIGVFSWLCVGSFLKCVILYSYVEYFYLLHVPVYDLQVKYALFCENQRRFDINIDKNRSWLLHTMEMSMCFQCCNFSFESWHRINPFFKLHKDV